MEIASVIGREKALYLIGCLGRSGKRPWRLNLYIPRHPGDSHPLVKILGKEDALRMAREFGGMNLQPANGNALVRRFRSREIQRLVTEGKPVRDIADLFQVTQRTVLNAIKINKNNHNYYEGI
ncbi:response regulator transcription factor [Haematospirillum sp. H1815]|uniref:response regulator transcription factor n=1 Tax=Haematospirillum sp. H1815 TaxID=2723108 RepID=UPI00143B8A3A|nr:response regulator transcription factor [Haematospirillum sp. H1815]NKD78153.1 response regulator transcription factor [Haematospirillum sp. H1815]